MEERYKRSRDNVETRGVATYTKFRRFQVITSESMADDDGKKADPADQKEGK